jgi:hypothetical protein
MAVSVMSRPQPGQWSTVLPPAAAFQASGMSKTSWPIKKLDTYATKTRVTAAFLGCHIFDTPDDISTHKPLKTIDIPALLGCHLPTDF